MATYTTHYNLKKPDQGDNVKVSDLNDNYDSLDTAIYNASQSGGSATGMIEPSSEAESTSAHAYASGDHFVYNNTLYRATAAIAVGDTITPGTNCIATTVAGELENKKEKQTAVTDPTASGNALAFIDSITQDAEGKIVPTKKNLDIDNSPTQNSNKPVKSGGVFTALAGKAALSIVAPIEESTTASQAYDAGDLFILNGVLYKATTSIASGGTITVGTNCQSVTISQMLELSGGGSQVYTLTLGTGWSGNASPYTQSVSFSGYTPTANTKVDLSAGDSVVEAMIADGTRMIYVENNNGVLTAYAVGNKPTVALSVCAEVKET